MPYEWHLETKAFSSEALIPLAALKLSSETPKYTASAPFSTAARAQSQSPAGAINSCVADLAKWVTVQLNHGGMGSSRLFSEAQSKEMWSAQTVMPIGAPAALGALGPNFSAYGLGWGLNDYRGKKIVSHTGGLAGYVSRVTMAPDLKLGVVVLTNQEADGAFQAVTYTILDRYLGAPEKAYWPAQVLLGLDPQNPYALSLVACGEAQRGNPTEAIKDIQAALQKLPGDPFVLRTAAQLAAWFDSEADPAFLPDAVKKAVAKIKQDLAVSPAFANAYKAAMAAYACPSPYANERAPCASEPAVTRRPPSARKRSTIGAAGYVSPGGWRRPEEFTSSAVPVSTSARRSGS